MKFFPITTIDSGQIVALEAIVPLPSHPAITDLALIEAARQMSLWNSRYPSRPALTLSFDVDSGRFSDQDFAEEINGIVRGASLDPHYVQLEINQTSNWLEDTAPIRENLNRLRELGLKICIDNFGTGYSSLRSLDDDLVDGLKIKACLFDREILQTVAVLALSKSMISTVMGVTDEQDLKDCCDFGYNYAQASEPMSVEEIEVKIFQGNDTG